MRELQEYERKAELLKALSHPLRLRIVHGLLTTGCHNVRCMEEKTGQSQSCVSQHLQKLKAVGAVTAERTGSEVYYRATPEAARLAAALFEEEVETYVL